MKVNYFKGRNDEEKENFQIADISMLLRLFKLENEHSSSCDLGIGTPLS
jgi:hypothetical protein